MLYEHKGKWGTHKVSRLAVQGFPMGPKITVCHPKFAPFRPSFAPTVAPNSSLFALSSPRLSPCFRPNLKRD
ncbi:hypothetical protein EGW35_13395 [Enterococcus durans]|uniref:Uncharacterized protein n=1 Tax=Enterococcus faecium TaxID=1352 RepID=A0AB37VTT5_ENTFC|nr:hypothetical protein [Enterococcus faecium]PQD42185.1 hypothetical protein CUM72_00355 [Enterococcus durans]PQH00116.1 hypothetical protein CUS52_02905 [Enterococcus faecium]ROX79898.1 hypothetical protein EGW35_13395 [Enterococcus durans]RXU71451.1 hypothetical protein CYQ86_08780 [Enterococcus faecium]